jgi:hypothetical protein
MHQAHPTAPLPSFLQDRGAAGQTLPQVEILGGQGERAQAVLGYVVTKLNEQLFTELMQGFHAPRWYTGDFAGEGEEGD